MTASIAHISVDCADPHRLALFWSEVLGLPLGEHDEPGDDEVGLGEGQVLFLRVPEPKTVKNRLHLCLNPPRNRDEEVERVLGLGATVVADRRQPDGTGWVVMADPEGNEFCVLRSAAERARTAAERAAAP
ncbi:VOC family protein [Actinokineospora bangkokensis]|uniref:Glyoxalase n=1 Tax=Actinokineospora bangkokensis TaxID=1193682 RepID=A0A1Q9LL45_9PSEU|nr:VOC family protein [Actinokineospora bangkokensis]OLR92714.1 glyoxalase [Actinokineospora bangkokensis]